MDERLCVGTGIGRGLGNARFLAAADPGFFETRSTRREAVGSGVDEISPRECVEGKEKRPRTEPKLKGAEDEEGPTWKGGVATDGQENSGKCDGIHRKRVLGKWTTVEGERKDVLGADGMGGSDGVEGGSDPREGRGVEVAALVGRGLSGKGVGAFTPWSGG